MLALREMMIDPVRTAPLIPITTPITTAISANLRI